LILLNVPVMADDYDFITETLFTAVPEEGGTVIFDEGIFEYDATTTVTASPNDGWEFEGWFDENGERVSSDATWLFPITSETADMTFEARFIQTELTTEPLAEQSEPQEQGPQPPLQDGLPQTGINNITPLMAITGMAIGFLTIIIKEIALISKKRKKSRFMFVTYIGVLTILFSVTVYGLDFYEDLKIYNNNLRTNQILREQIKEIKAHEEADHNDNYVQNIPQLIEIDGEFYLGILNIPELDLELPVNNEWSDERLNVSPCRYSGDFDGQLVICAHDYNFHFGNISRLSAGDKIIITDAEGHEHIYVAELIEIIAGTDIDGMINIPYDLTLFTCTPDGKDRIAVRCNKE